MLQEIVGRGGALASQMVDGTPKVDRVPVDDRCGDEIEAGRSIALVFERPIGETALFVYENGLIERMARLALVQPGMTSPPQFWAFQPIEHEYRALEPAKLGKCEVEPVLSRKGGKLFHLTASIPERNPAAASQSAGDRITPHRHPFWHSYPRSGRPPRKASGYGDRRHRQHDKPH